MAWASPAFVLILVAIGVVGWLVNNWMRMRHGIPTDEELGMIATREMREAGQNNSRLVEQNARLTDLVERLEDRIAVLERIAVDPAERTARDIEDLRSR